MHVLYFHQHFSTPAGATGTRSYEMARELAARGHEVTMVCGSSAHGDTRLNATPVNGVREGDVDGIHVVEICVPYSNHDGLAKRSLAFMRFALRSVAIAWKTKYDLLFATSTPLTAALPGIVMRLLKPNKAFIFEVRDLWPELPREMGVITNPVVLSAMSALEWLAYNLANSCIGLSPGIVEGIKRRCSQRKAVAMIPNGCDLDAFRPQGTRGSRAGKTKLKAVFMGAHGMANGLDAVLDAAMVLKHRNRNDIELLFIGDGKLKPQLVARAQNEGLDNCRFVAPVPKTILTGMMADADVGLMILANVRAFYYGTSPNKFFDYISAGLPVVNNYPGWLADLINEHQCGIAVPPDNPEAFADAIEKLADRPDLREQMGRNARRLAQQRFDRRTLAASFADFLEESGKCRVSSALGARAVPVETPRKAA
jgi:glycosyltransferase involved in cell wall biosynthesis